MKYMGSKRRIAKEILPIILKDRKEGQWYVEPFCGGCNTLDKVSGNRIANDSNEYLIEMWKEIVNNGWIPPDYVEEETHSDVKANPEKYDKHFIAFVRFGCSFGSDWNGGFARNVRKDKPNAELLNRTTKSYCKQSKNNILKQSKNLKDVVFHSGNYWELSIPEKSIIYCDPPYKGTTKYKDDFDHDSFWKWCEEMSKMGHKVFVSEYNAPENWECIWEQSLRNGLNNRQIEFNKVAKEKLFTLKSE